MVPVTLEFAKAGKVEVQFMVGRSKRYKHGAQLMNMRCRSLCVYGR